MKNGKNATLSTWFGRMILLIIVWMLFFLIAGRPTKMLPYGIASFVLFPVFNLTWWWGMSIPIGSSKRRKVFLLHVVLSILGMICFGYSLVAMMFTMISNP